MEPSTSIPSSRSDGRPDHPGPWSAARSLDDGLISTWHCWARSRRGRRRRASWALRHPALRAWAVDDLAAPVGSPATDGMQAALVRLAQAGDVDAAMTLLVQLRPGLLRLLRTLIAAGAAPRETADEIQAVFFETLYRHRLDRRPARIAANLLLDTRQRVLLAHRRTDRADRAATADPGLRRRAEGWVAAAEPAELVATVDAVRSTLRSLPGSVESRQLSAAVAYRAWVLDEPRRSIAADLDVDPEVVTTRLHRLRRALRSADLDR